MRASSSAPDLKKACPAVATQPARVARGRAQRFGFLSDALSRLLGLADLVRHRGAYCPNDQPRDGQDQQSE